MLIHRLWWFSFLILFRLLEQSCTRALQWELTAASTPAELWWCRAQNLSRASTGARRWSTYALVILCSCAIRCNPFSTRKTCVTQVTLGAVFWVQKATETQQTWNECFGRLGHIGHISTLCPASKNWAWRFCTSPQSPRNTFWEQPMFRTGNGCFQE